jgi:hypothetical protein
LPVGPEMFDICGRSSLIFSRDIQGIWYGGWPYTYISLSLSRVSCHLHISPSACIHYPIGPAFTQQLSRHWWHRVKYEDQHGRDPPFGMANAQLLQLHQSQSAAQADLYTHTHSPREIFLSCNAIHNITNSVPVTNKTPSARATGLKRNYSRPR